MTALSSAIVDLRRGALLRVLDDESDVLLRFAMIAPELLAADRAAWASEVIERVAPGAETAHLDSVLVVARTGVRIAQRLPWDPDKALVSVIARTENVGAVLALARARLLSLERDA